MTLQREIGRAEAQLVFSDINDINELGGIEGQEIIFPMLNPAEKILAFPAFKKTLHDLLKKDGTFQERLLSEYLAQIRDHWLSPELLPGWVRARNLQKMLTLFSDIPDQGRAIKISWSNAVDISTTPRNCIMALQMVAQVPEKEAESLIRKFRLDTTLGVAHRLNEVVKNSPRNPDTLAGIRIKYQEVQEDLCNVWVLALQIENEEKEKKQRQAIIMEDLLESAGGLSEICEDIFHATLMKSPGQLASIASTNFSEYDNAQIKKGIAKIRNAHLLHLGNGNQTIKKTLPRM